MDRGKPEIVRRKIWTENDVQVSRCTIPKLLHFIWVGGNPPAWSDRLVGRFAELNPEFKVMLHDESALDPSMDVIYRAAKQKPECKCDVLRLCVLRRYGGWYFDRDFVPVRPLAGLETKYDIADCFLTQQFLHGRKRINNAVIGLSSGSLVWSVIDELVEEIISSRRIERTSFGPLLMTQLSERCRDVPIAAMGDFYPFPIRRSGQARTVARCLLRSGFSRDVVRQHFNGDLPFAFHLWMGGAKRL